MTAQELFAGLVESYGAKVDRRGEAHIACPHCGAAPKRGAVHFSFSPRGGYCFVCGQKASLRLLAERAGVAAAPAAPAPKRDLRPATWRAEAEAYVSRYERHSRRLELWQAYKPLPEAVIRARRLGVGVLPASRCHHERLIVPVLDGTMIVGLRGRALGCACDKWLVASGTPLEQLPLYNAEALRPGATVLLVENPVDALMVGVQTAYIGVATYSVAYWRAAWGQTLAASRPARILVAYDNDLPGNGGAARRAEFVADWQRAHGGSQIPPARGPERVAQLHQLGLAAALFDWGAAPHKADIGSLLKDS